MNDEDVKITPEAMKDFLKIEPVWKKSKIKPTIFIGMKKKEKCNCLGPPSKLKESYYGFECEDCGQFYRDDIFDVPEEFE